MSRFFCHRKIYIKLLSTTNLKHEGVHFLLNVLMGQVVAIFICGFQKHVQKGVSIFYNLVRVAFCFNVGQVLRLFTYHLNIDKVRDVDHS